MKSAWFRGLLPVPPVLPVPSVLPGLFRLPALRRRPALCLLLSLCLLPGAASPLYAQVLLSGRVVEEAPPVGVLPGGRRPAAFSTIVSTASLPGPGGEARSFRTWETEPVGWYRISGGAGRYTLVFSNPAHFIRPIVATNVFLADGERVDRDVSPRFDHAVFFEGSWDEKPAAEYVQPFVARGTSVTHVGFKLAHDGVDGGGPGAQTLLLSVHREGDGPPEGWEQVGPSVPVPGVDCGGPKSLAFSAGWCSGEVPTTPGETYAIRIRAEIPGAAFQAFWMPRPGGAGGCYRVGKDGGRGFTGRDLWLAVGTDSDGILVPYAKRVHRQFVDFAGFRSRWSQTYVAQGWGLAGATLYAAVGGTQPPLSRQRVRVRVREGGPNGPVVGVEKVAIGNGNYTGDASWGAFGVAFAPGEAPLEPGKVYAVDFESIETRETLYGFVNIKGQVSDERPGFNPYRKVPPDDYAGGTAYAGGESAVDFDLDMQIVEYAAAAERWEEAVRAENLVANGDAEAGDLDPLRPAAGRPSGWKAFSVDPATEHGYVLEEPERRNRLLRVRGGGKKGTTVDGGYVQRVGGLRRGETYRLAGRLRCSWPLDVDNSVEVGLDPTGQDADPDAATIVWRRFPDIHGVFMPFRTEPVRPRAEAISVWLRARSRAPTPWEFRADFDDLELRQVRTDAPGPTPGR